MAAHQTTVGEIDSSGYRVLGEDSLEGSHCGYVDDFYAVIGRACRHLVAVEPGNRVDWRSVMVRFFDHPWNGLGIGFFLLILDCGQIVVILFHKILGYFVNADEAFAPHRAEMSVQHRVNIYCENAASLLIHRDLRERRPLGKSTDFYLFSESSSDGVIGARLGRWKGFNCLNGVAMNFGMVFGNLFGSFARVKGNCAIEH